MVLSILELYLGYSWAVIIFTFILFWDVNWFIYKNGNEVRNLQETGQIRLLTVMDA